MKTWKNLRKTRNLFEKLENVARKNQENLNETPKRHEKTRKLEFFESLGKSCTMYKLRKIWSKQLKGTKANRYHKILSGKIKQFWRFSWKVARTELKLAGKSWKLCENQVGVGKVKEWDNFCYEGQGLLEEGRHNGSVYLHKRFDLTLLGFIVSYMVLHPGYVIYHRVFLV